MKIKIGNTPLKRLFAIEKKYDLQAELYAKIEGENAGGSIKDRVALQMIEDAEKENRLTKGATVIEATSGNTGIGLALVCKNKGYKAIIVMPDTMTVERQELIKSYGGEVLLTDGKKGMQGAVEKAEALALEIKGAMLAKQFENPSNPKAHYENTAPELYVQTKGEIDVFLAGIGTGGTITGVGKFLKEKNPQIKVVGVEPENSPLLSKGYFGSHAIQGIGANFIPKVLNTSIYDTLMTAGDNESIEMMKSLKEEENLSVGISSGAVLACAIALAKKEEMKGKKIAMIFPDEGGRYSSIV